MNSSIKDFQQAILRNKVNVQEFFSILMEKLIRLNESYGFFHARPTNEQLHEYLHHSRYVTDSTLQFYPISVKDNICTKGLETTAGSRILDGYLPPFDATVVTRIKNAGGVILGKTTMDEFGFGTFSLNSAHEIPRNAFNPELVAGGSSGGAAVLTALLSHHGALAVSTGGSISCPASFNGVIGLTPTYGLVSRWGLIDYANSLDKIGVMGRRVEDVSTILSKITGPDDKDSTVRPHSMKNNGKSLEKRLSLKVGVLENVLEGCDPRIVNQFQRVLNQLQSELSVEVATVTVPSNEFSVAAYYIIATAEASTNLARYDGLRYGRQSNAFEEHFDEFFSTHRSKYFGKEAKRRILLGTFARMAGYKDKYYFKALKIRHALIKEFKEILATFDVVVTPTMPIFPPKIEDASKLKPVEVYALDQLTIPPNLCGFPHLTLPMMHDPAPAGFQIIADHFNEQILFDLGKHWEEWHPPQAPKEHLNMLELM